MSDFVIPKEHDVVRLLYDYAGLPKGSEGTVVSVHSPTEEEVEVEFNGCNIVSVLSRHFEIIWTPEPLYESLRADDFNR